MADNYGPTLVALGQYAAFTTFVPSLREVRNASPDDAALVADIRQGEIVATGVSLTIAASASAMSRTLLPFLVAILVCAGMIALYEFTLYNSPFGPTKEKAA